MLSGGYVGVLLCDSVDFLHSKVLDDPDHEFRAPNSERGVEYAYKREHDAVATQHHCSASW